MEIYIVHLILMITAQYRYIALKMAVILEEENEGEFQKKRSPEFYRNKENEIRILCRHHNNVIQ